MKTNFGFRAKWRKIWCHISAAAAIEGRGKRGRKSKKEEKTAQDPEKPERKPRQREKQEKSSGKQEKMIGFFRKNKNTILSKTKNGDTILYIDFFWATRYNQGVTRVLQIKSVIKMERELLIQRRMGYPVCFDAP